MIRRSCNVDIQGGAFGLQTSTAQLGDPAGTITVRNDAYFNVWALPAGVNKKIVMENGSTYWSDSGTTENLGPVTLAGGTATILNDGGTTLRFVTNGIITGPANLVIRGGGTTEMASSNGWTGNTVVSNGTLALIETSLNNSPVIRLGSTNTTGTIDVSRPH